MPKAQPDVAAWEPEYRRLASLGEALAAQLKDQLARVMEDREIALGFPIQHRVKSWSSITEKLERTDLTLGKLADLHDLVGLRVVLQFRRDVLTVCELIEKTLRVVGKYDTQERLKEDQFGYASTHYVVGLPEAWLSVPTMVGLGELQAEIQVRTLAQHIWAAASHTLQYKQEQSVPVSLRRGIYRVSALLETVDLEFERLLTERAAYREQIIAQDTKQEVEELNVDLLEKVLDELLPPQNKNPGDEGYGELLGQLLAHGIRTPSQLRQLWEERGQAALNQEAAQVKRVRAEVAAGEQPSGSTSERATKGVYFTHVGLARVALLGLTVPVTVPALKPSDLSS
jgi:putative GTP pyrophosphokinase